MELKMEVDKEITDKFLELVDEIPNFLFTPPAHSIFHYTSAAGLSGILKTNTLFFTRWDFLNDSSEYLQVHELLEKSINAYKNEKEFYSIIKASNESARAQKSLPHSNGSPLDLYIASFSADKDALNMWTYYSKSNKSDGYCIQFNPQKLVSDIGPNIAIREVIYSPVLKINLLNDLLKRVFNFYLNLKNNSELAPLSELYLSSYVRLMTTYIGCFIKHSSFANEKEIRAALFVKRSDDHAEYNFKSRISQGIIIPYTEVEFKKEDIQSVTISPTLPKQESAAGIAFLRDQLGYKFRIEHSAIPLRNI